MARRRKKPKREYLKQTFEAREFPTAIFMAGGEEEIMGPFCVHCGNPWMYHGPDERCPNVHLHPLFPPPRLPFAPDPEL